VLHVSLTPSDVMVGAWILARAFAGPVSRRSARRPSERGDGGHGTHLGPTATLLGKHRAVRNPKHYIVLRSSSPGPVGVVGMASPLRARLKLRPPKLPGVRKKHFRGSVRAATLLQIKKIKRGLAAARKQAEKNNDLQIWKDAKASARAEGNLTTVDRNKAHTETLRQAPLARRMAGLEQALLNATRVWMVVATHHTG
jgi:hypothetical protein